MNTILQHRFLNIVSGGDLTTNIDLQAVYTEFLVVLKQIVDTMESYSLAYRLLTPLEDVLSLNSRPTKSRTSEVVYFVKLALRCVRAELKLLERRVTNPELFVNYNDSSKHSDLKWNGTQTELNELLTALDLSEVIHSRSTGNKATFSDIIATFEMMLGLSLGDAKYIKRTILRRKTKLTSFLDSLKGRLTIDEF